MTSKLVGEPLQLSEDMFCKPIFNRLNEIVSLHVNDNGTGDEMVFVGSELERLHEVLSEIINAKEDRQQAMDHSVVSVTLRPPKELVAEVNRRKKAMDRRAVGPCPCVCNSGGFCGGCGHAGCGRR
jgi:hypothetical protein